jgi:threonine/homoserine/homoserine lactone efflux protein
LLLLSFLAEAVLISLSGVMSPGPITAVVVGRGGESPYAGPLVALGHGLVEFPLIALIAWGFGTLIQRGWVHTAIALVGGVLLLIMGIGMLRSRRGGGQEAVPAHRYPLVAGLLLSAGNPFFLIWWVTVGAALIGRSLQFGTWGPVALGLAHWSVDLTWCTVLSVLAYRGRRTFGPRFQEALFVLCGAFLVLFGGRYIYEAVTAIVA